MERPQTSVPERLQLCLQPVLHFYEHFKAKGQLERTQKRHKSQCFKIVQTHPALGEINANAPEGTFQYISILSSL